MRRPDDYSLPDAQLLLIRKHAQHALVAAGALGRFPTPVDEVMSAAKVIVSDEQALDTGFLAKLRNRAGTALLRAISKVLGVLDAAAKIVYIDQSLLAVKRTFLKLHETAHAVLPWQRDIFIVAEDCEMTLAPEIAESFEREANAFASEVLFQLDSFQSEAEDMKASILVPVRLSRRYGASIYSSVRRYVSKNSRVCAVLVLEPPIPCARRGFIAKLRREIVSPSFRSTIGHLSWPDEFSSEDSIGAVIPFGGNRRMSRPRPLSLRGKDGRVHECIVEAFTQSHQVFVLIHSFAAQKLKLVIAASTTESRLDADQ